eukprot:TRINITY_DN18164_c0_g1_i1.p1 TRINITY_DN18164_c0_g1~~TRINITY_DN18164_c0_g1_i1.p1  ORF type:complete len:313 (-),score=84.46 TRINITY_DN18164_c0_g1_i1:14-952(-)
MESEAKRPRMESGTHGSVFIFAAGGFIGQGVARAFRREGYLVYGLIRREEQMGELILNEIIPVLGDAGKPETYKEFTDKSRIIVDCSHGDDKKVAQAIINTIQSAPQDRLLQSKVFIYTSGIMVYEHDERTRDEAWPIGSTEYASMRRDMETFYLNSEKINPIIIRPGWVYGRDMRNNKEFFEKPESGKIYIYGKHPARRYSWIHVDDLGDGYVAAARAGSSVSGQIFNLVGYDTPKWEDLMKKGIQLAKSGAELVYAPSRGNYVDELRDAEVVLSPKKAMDMLGWAPKHIGLLENLELYFNAYDQHFNKKK